MNERVNTSPSSFHFLSPTLLYDHFLIAIKNEEKEPATVQSQIENSKMEGVRFDSPP